MMSILECVGLDGLPAVEAACQEALDQGVFWPPSSSTSWPANVIRSRPPSFPFPTRFA
jgi:hypothetical protein